MVVCKKTKNIDEGSHFTLGVPKFHLEGAVKRILKVKGAAASSAPPLPASLQKKPKPQQEQHKVPF